MPSIVPLGLRTAEPVQAERRDWKGIFYYVIIILLAVDCLGCDYGIHFYFIL